MKNSMVISCRSCGYEKDFYFGVGLLHSGAVDFDSEYALLPRFVKDPEVLEDLRRAVESGAELETEYRYGLYRCPKCGEFHKCFEYCLKFSDGMIERPKYVCECGEILESLDLESFVPENYPCPACGKQTLEEGFSALMPDFD